MDSDGVLVQAKNFDSRICQLQVESFDSLCSLVGVWGTQLLPHTLTLSRYSPNAPRSTDAISPTVACCSTASRIAGIRFAPVRACSSTRSRADRQRPESRLAR